MSNNNSLNNYFGIHNHTIYSNIRLLDATNQPKDLINKAIELGLSGIAITDHECLSAHVKAEKYMASIKERVDLALDEIRNILAMDGGGIELEEF